ncbi:MAG: outer membrane lipoprotein-sorting protein [Thermodesulfobacteriota bacterium]|nr:outer membrane lipoprotein-sorting protein [Thermodesulfobacteriota bacterium]
MKGLVFSFFLFVSSLVFATWSLGFEDCYNYKYLRNDTKKYSMGQDRLEAFESNKDNFILEKRWPTINLKLTPQEEMSRFGTTGLEVAKKAYLAQHFDGTQIRGSVCLTITREKGVRRIKGWRVEKNPPMPREYLDPAYPEEKKKGIDWSILVHWTYPPDIRGAGLLIQSYNNKKKDHDTWVWFPSLRKVRRLTPSNGDDSVAGSYKTFSNGFLRRIGDEIHQIIGETMANGLYGLTYYDFVALEHKHPPHSPEFDRVMRRSLRPRECWVVRSVSVKGGYCDYYHTRVWVGDKEWGYGPLVEEYYNGSGKLFITENWPYMRQTGINMEIAAHWAGYANDINFEERGFNTWNAPEYGLGYKNPDEWFTLRELMRSVPTDYIPYMPVTPPKKLLPIENIFPSKELQEAYRKQFPEPVRQFPGEVRF